MICLWHWAKLCWTGWQNCHQSILISLLLVSWKLDQMTFQTGSAFSKKLTRSIAWVLRVEVLSSGVIRGVFEEPWVKSRGAILTTLQDNQRTNLPVPTGAVFLIWQIHVLWLICHECCIEWKVNWPGSMAIRKFPGDYAMPACSRMMGPQRPI